MLIMLIITLTRLQSSLAPPHPHITLLQGNPKWGKEEKKTLLIIVIIFIPKQHSHTHPPQSTFI